MTVSAPADESADGGSTPDAGALDAGTVEAVLDLVGRLAAAADLETYARAACVGILDLVPSLSVSYNEMNPPAGRVYALIVPDPGPGWFRRFQPPFERRMGDNPLIRHASVTGDTRVLAWGDPGLGSVEGTALDREFYRPNGIRSQLAVTLPAPPGVVIGFGVNRGEEGFGPPERRILELLRPHLVHAYRAVQARGESAVLGSALAEHGWAVVLVDDAARVVRSSPGTAQAAARFGLDVADGALLDGGPLAGVRAAIAAYAPGEPATPRPPQRVLGPAGVLEAVLVPSTVGPHVVLLRHRPGAAQSLAGLGLTARQRAVALALAGGGSNRDIARALGIAPATVKKHLEAVFARLGVSHRGAAVARIRSVVDGPPPSAEDADSPP